MRLVGYAGLVAVALVAFPLDEVRADIRCGWQASNTPYCQDELLAEVARSYGTRVTGNEIRANPNLKREMCRFIGHDNRVQHVCSSWQDHPGGGAAAAGGSQ